MRHRFKRGVLGAARVAKEFPAGIVRRIPFDPDAQNGRIVTRERVLVLALIFVGGSVGTAARVAIGSAFPAGDWPWATFWINIFGAAVLALVLEFLAAFGPDEGWLRRARLGIGTGVLGGFTTYSAFSVEVAQMVRSGAIWMGAGYALASVAVGVTAAFFAGRVGRHTFCRLQLRFEKPEKPAAQPGEAQ